MDKLIDSAFDFFSYALPGVLIALALPLVFVPVEEAPDFYMSVFSLGTPGSIGIVFLGYLIGFFITPWGRDLFRKVGKQRIKDEVVNTSDIHISAKFILIREFSPSNFKYVEKWNVYCIMSHNLALACLIVTVILAVRILLTPGLGALYLILSLLVGGFLFWGFLKLAIKFFVWAQNDLNAAISELRLIDKAGK